MNRIITACLLLTVTPAAATDWPNWRGPTNDGIAPHGPPPPLNWDESTNILWRTALPGRGHGSPTVVGDRIYLATAEVDKRTQSVMAVDRINGQIVWHKPVFVNVAWPKIHDKNTHASSTVAGDGTSLYISFCGDAKVRHACLDLNGDVRWQRDVARFRPKYPFGYAASPLLYHDLVIATSESESETVLVAYHREIGQEIWRAQRPRNSS